MDLKKRLNLLEERLEREEDRRLYPALAKLLWDSGDTSRALAVIERGESRFPDYIPILMVAAELRRSAGEPERVLAAYRRIAELDPSHSVALESLAADHLENGRGDQAAGLYRRLLEIDPDNDRAAEFLGRLDGDHVPGTEGQEDSGESLPGPRPTETLAELYAAQGAPGRAAAVYRKLLEKDASNDGWRARLEELEARART